jgi:uncharacterized protein YqiB (DUF1249 family)
MLRLRPLVAIVFLAVPALAADLELRFSALERILAEQMFTQDGKRYVKGNAQTKCQFAYLESPRLGTHEERLKVTARFSGRSALDMFGRCVGLGDSFDLTLTALPAPKDGAIALRDVKVTTVKDSYYIRRVRAALERSFSKEFKIEVKDQARRLLEQSGGGSYGREMTGFDLNGVHVIEGALVLAVEFKLVIK